MNRRLYIASPIAAIVAVVAGAALVAWAEAQSVTFGWFAYAPLSGTRFTPQVSPGGNGVVFGVVVVAIGLTAFAFWSAARSAFRRRPVASAAFALVALLMVVVGVTVVAMSQLTPPDVFQPTPNETAIGSGYIPDGSAVGFGVGTTLVVLGMVGFAFWSGVRAAGVLAGPQPS